MGGTLLKLYDATVLRFPRAVLLMVLVLAAVMAAGLQYFKIDASADSLTLEHDGDLDYFREVTQRYGSNNLLVVTYTPRDMALFSDESLATLQAISKDLAEVDGIVNVQSMVNVPLLFSPRIEIADLDKEPRTLMTPGVDKDAAREEFRTSPIYKDLILGPDGQTTGIVATVASDPTYLKMVRERDALRKKRDEQGLTEAEAARLETVSREFREYRTESEAESYQRVQEVRSLLDKYRDKAQLFLGGPDMITADMVDYVANGVVLFIVLALAIIFRQLRWVVLPMASCTLAVVLMLGWLGWVDWRLTVISSNFVAVLLIIAMAVTIHLVVRYRELHWRHPDLDNRELVRQTVGFMFKPCLYTVLTTMVAFVSLVVSDIGPVIDFGWMMTIGLLVAFVLVFIIIPAGILAWGKRPVRHRVSEDSPHTLYFSRFTENHGTLVLVLSAVVAVASAIGISRLEVDNKFIDYFRKDTEIHKGLSVIDKNLGGTTPFDIIIHKSAADAGFAGTGGEPTAGAGGGNSAGTATGTGYAVGEDPFGFEEAGDDPFAATGGGGSENTDADPFAMPADGAEEDPFAFDGDPFAQDPFSGENASGSSGSGASEPVTQNYWFTRAGLEQLDKLHSYLEEMPEIGKVNSPVTAYRVANQLTGQRMNDFELLFMRRSLSPEINDILIAPYLDDEREEARFSMRTVETASDLKRAELLQQVRDFIENEMGLSPEDYRFSGLLVLYNNMLQSLYTSQILTLGAVFVGIMLMFLVLFRSLSVAVIAITPNILAAAAIVGGMGLFGVPLDMMTITIAAITVGIGVDDTIHYVHRFKREFQEDRNYLATMHRAHGSIGKAMYYTSVIIIAGFSILTLSNFVPSILFGLLTGVAMLVALLGALALLPKLIMVFKPFGPEGEQ